MMRVITDDELPRQGAHLTDGELLYLAGERRDAAREAPLRFEDARERDRARHLEGCADCGRRLALLERRARRLSALVAEIDVPAGFRHPVLRARPRWRPGGWVRAAAIVLVVLSSLLLVPPVRAWALGWVSARWMRIVAGAPAGTSAPRAEGPAAVGASTRVGFVPAGDELSIVLTAEQAGGALILTRTSASEVVFEVVGGTGGGTPLVHADGLRILNVATSRASYLVALPPSVQRIHVSVGARARILVRRVHIGRELRVDLR
jgi:hypothetical protein